MKVKIKNRQKMTGLWSWDPPPSGASGIGQNFFDDATAPDPEALEGSLGSMVNGGAIGG
ncbi:hypothetical protein [Kaistella faecalis]|uniref:hypothetical protein n=1 Tax=Kaistella faecalis TaxID=2852098 RepID=UPI001C47F119|nr:hypothetical protein [Chryseobacterium faecale]UFK98616.1 hypothetical protein LL667_04470 [Chryseobacterium faecale]